MASHSFDFLPSPPTESLSYSCYTLWKAYPIMTCSYSFHSEGCLYQVTSVIQYQANNHFVTWILDADGKYKHFSFMIIGVGTEL